MLLAALPRVVTEQAAVMELWRLMGCPSLCALHEKAVRSPQSVLSLDQAVCWRYVKNLIVKMNTFPYYYHAFA